MTEFADHGGPVHDVEFHPHEFLLASASRYFELNDLIIMFEILFWVFLVFSGIGASSSGTWSPSSSSPPRTRTPGLSGENQDIAHAAVIPFILCLVPFTSVYVY